MSDLLDSLDFDLGEVFYESDGGFAQLAGWYPNGQAANAQEVNITIFYDEVVLQETNQIVEGQEIRVEGAEADFRPSSKHNYNVDYDDILVWTDRYDKQTQAYRIRSIQPDGTGKIEFLVLLADDIVV